jgi:CheY-like chemotaxis protein
MAKIPSILIVEDDTEITEMLREHLEEDYDVVTVAWGKDALRVALKKPPDIAVLDISLGESEMDGYEVCRRLGEHRRTERIPIIFLTARIEHTDRLEGLSLGAVDYITKPFDIEELDLRIRNALRRANLTTLVNPITGLPTDPLVDEKLAELLPQQDWALLSVGIQGLEDFSDRYGFVVSDDFLRAMAVMMKEAAQELGDRNPFIGHLEEADFIICSTPSMVSALRKRISARLDRTLNFFYPVQDLEDPKEPRPSISLSMGVVTPDEGPFHTPGEIKAAALDAQAFA